MATSPEILAHGGPLRLLMRAIVLGFGLAALTATAAGEDPPIVFPDLEFAGADGGSVKLSQLKGNVLLVNVWATWCGPCRMELPIVQKMYDTYSDRNLVVLAVNIDADRNRVDPFLKKYNLSLPVYFANPEDAGQMTAAGIPTTFLIGVDRVLLQSYVGYSADVENRWKQLLDKHLKPSRKR
jgi:thiol-disulfide isomerase/thioredoxin